MKLPQRPKRFIVIPGPSSPSVAPTPLRTMRLMRLDLRGGAPVVAAVRNGARAARKTIRAAVRPETVKVVNRSPADGALLLQPQDHFTLDQLKAHAPEGTKVLEEQWYSLERPARPWSAQSTALKKPHLRAGQTVSWSVTVVLDDGQRRRLAGALVTVMTNEGKGIGLEGTTDRYGRVSFELSDKTKSVDTIYVDPLHVDPHRDSAQPALCIKHLALRVPSSPELNRPGF